MRFLKDLMLMMMFAPDTGDSGGTSSSSSEGEPNEPNEPTGEPSEPTSEPNEGEPNSSEEGIKENVKTPDLDLNGMTEEPKPKASYVTQLKKEYQDYDLSEVPTINDLVKHYKESKEAKERTIEIPKKGSSKEEIRAFLDKMGVPKDPSGYGILKGNLTDAEFSSIKETFQKTAYSSALSEGQAEKVWNMVSQQFVQQRMAVTDFNKQVIESFEPRFDEYLKTQENIIDGNARKIKIEENAKLFKAFSKDNGMETLFSKLGLNLNPEFITKMAKIQNKLNETGYVASNTSTKSDKVKSQFGDAFEKEFG